MATTDYVKIPISDIKVPKRRKRDLGDVAGLAASIKERGLLHDLVIDPNYNLLCGYRRLVALQELGKTHAPCKICHSAEDALAALLVERDENRQRKDLTPSEAVALGQLIEGLESPLAAKRRGQDSPSKPGHSEQLGESPELPVGKPGRTKAKAAEAVGMSESAYREAQAVVEAAAQDPKKYGDLLEKMDDAGKVHPAYVELQQRREAPESPPGLDFPPGLIDLIPAALNKGKLVANEQQLAALAKLDAEEQEALLVSVLEGKQTLAQAIERGGVPEPTLTEIIANKNALIEGFCRDLLKFVKESMPGDDPWLDHMGRKDTAVQKIKDACETLRTCKCVAACPRCQGAGCTHCLQTGRVSKYTLEQLS